MINDPPRHSRPPAGPDWDAIARFLAGESPAEEADVVRAWLDAHPVDRELVERLDGIVTVEMPTDLDIEGALARVHDRIDQAAIAPKLKVQRGGLRPPAPSRAPLIVGGVLAAAAAVFAIVKLQSGDKPVASTPTPVATARVFTTKVGQRDSIMLADGSHVILGPDSRLTVAADYGTSTRSVELQGDGYFDVKHNVTSPFSVHIGRAVVEDVGTTFTVESDGGDATVVSVLSGSVRLHGSDSSSAGALLAAGDRGSMATDGKVTASPHAVGSDDTAWTTGRLVFHDASLSRVAAEIHRWYGVDLRIADSSLAHARYSNSFQGEPIDQVLKVIALSVGARVERQGDTATLYTNRAPATPR